MLAPRSHSSPVKRTHEKKIEEGPCAGMGAAEWLGGCGGGGGGEGGRCVSGVGVGHGQRKRGKIWGIGKVGASPSNPKRNLGLSDSEGPRFPLRIQLGGSWPGFKTRSCNPMCKARTQDVVTSRIRAPKGGKISADKFLKPLPPSHPDGHDSPF